MDAATTILAAAGGDLVSTERAAALADAEPAWRASIGLLDALRDDTRPAPTAPEATRPPWCVVEGLLRVRLGFFQMDGPSVTAAHEALTRLPREMDSLPVAACRDWAAVVHAITVGRFDAALELLRALPTSLASGAAENVAWLVPELIACDALASLELGDVEHGLARARRAYRSARAEGAALSERFAALVLVRARRFDGSPHLAAFIAQSLLASDAGGLAAWAELEQVLAGGPFGGPPATLVTDLVARARRAPSRASASTLADLEDATRRLFATVDGFAPTATDVRVLGALLDARIPNERAPEVAAWRMGLEDDPPRGLLALLPDPLDPARPSALVLVSPGTPTRRVAPGTSWLLPDFAAAPVLGFTEHPRAGAVASALAFAGDAGLHADALFSQVYGFAYHAGRHGGARRVLFHRVKKLLEPHAELVRDGDVVRLVPHGPVVIVDPRGAPRSDAELLQLLARVGPSSAKQVADGLGLPLRTTQDALRRLAEEGVAHAVRDGRQHVFSIEETVFSALSPARSRADDETARRE